MQIINLNEREAATLIRRDFYIEIAGDTPELAVEKALAEHGGKPSRKFVEWLSQGRLTMNDGAVAPAA